MFVTLGILGPFVPGIDAFRISMVMMLVNCIWQTFVYVLFMILCQGVLKYSFADKRV